MRRDFLHRYLAVPLFLAVGMILCSCAESKPSEDLQVLEETISQRPVYEKAFLNETDSLRRALACAANDMERFDLAFNLYIRYKYHQSDTALIYIARMAQYAEHAADPQLKIIPVIESVWGYRAKGNFQQALDVFESLDASKMERRALIRYYYTGIALYMEQRDITGGALRDMNNERLNTLRSKYLTVDSTSVYSRYMRALRCRDEGKYEEAISILEPLLAIPGLSEHRYSVICYYLSTVYDKMEGGRTMRKHWLAESVNHDIKAAKNGHTSISELASMIMEDGDMELASRYIQMALNEVMDCDYVGKVQKAVMAQVTISKAISYAERSRGRMLLIGILSIFVVLVLLTVVFVRYRQFSERLRKAYKIIASYNTRISRINKQLSDANRIKSSYVASFIELSTHYIDEVDKMRSNLRKTAKNEGYDALMTALKAPSYASTEYDNFYNFFDGTFLKLYPDFVERVNELLAPDAKLSRRKDGSLSTEIRVLALIRLGVDESSRIASVLGCAVTTVYTYRTKVKSAALCPKEEFETRLKQIGL